MTNLADMGLATIGDYTVLDLDDPSKDTVVHENPIQRVQRWARENQTTALALGAVAVVGAGYLLVKASK